MQNGDFVPVVEAGIDLLFMIVDVAPLWQRRPPASTT